MSGRLTEIIKQVDAPSPEERRSLLAHLADRQCAATGPGPSPLRWQDLRGCGLRRTIEMTAAAVVR